MDGTKLKYLNWAEKSTKEHKCVKMSLLDHDLGKWTDDNCNEKYQVICQKKQASKNVLSDDIRNLTSQIQKLHAENQQIKSK